MEPTVDRLAGMGYHAARHEPTKQNSTYRGCGVVVAILGVAYFVFEQPPTAALGAPGIAGFAVAFAARDTVSNFFRSVTVLMDRPFGIGDWVVVGDVEETVERLGFRSTRVRTFYNS